MTLICSGFGLKMGIINHVFRRTLTTTTTVTTTTLPPSSALSPPIRRRLTCIPTAHVNKTTLISNPTSSFHPSIPKNKDPFHYRTRLSLVVDTEFKSPSRLCYSSLEGVRDSGGQMGRDGDEEKEDNKLLTLPTVLTLARVVAIPVFIATFYVNSWWGTTATTSIFVAAAITDWLDGYLARKMRLGTAFGAFLDPVADKLMVAATLVLLCSRPPETSLLGDVPWLFPVPATAIIGREITMSAVREWAASQDTKLLQAVAVNNLGKWKTATQMIALTILVASRDSSLVGSGTLVASGVALLYISAGLALWSLAVYMRKIWKVLLR